MSFTFGTGFGAPHWLMSQECRKRHADEKAEAMAEFAIAKKPKLAHIEQEEEAEENAAPEEVRVKSSCISGAAPPPD